MIDFSTLKSLAISEGNVTQIESGGVVLWKAAPSGATVKVTLENTNSFASMTHSPNAYISVNGVIHRTTEEFVVPIGTVIGCNCSKTMSENTTNTVGIYLNGAKVSTEGQYSATYNYTVVGDVEIKLCNSLKMSGSGSSMRQDLTTYIYITELPAYAAVYGGDTLVFGRGESVPENYNSKSLTESWRGIENLLAAYASQVPWYDNYQTAITNVVVVDVVKPKSTAYWFYKMNACASMDLKLVNTTNVTDMSYMFCECSSLTTLNVSNFDTTKVTNMYRLFYKCSNLTSLDLSNFNTANVTGTKMKEMFYECSSLTSLDVSNFNTAKITDMGQMFIGCSSLTSLNLSNFNTTNVTDMYYMFGDCSSLTTLNVSNFDTTKVTDMGHMFNNCSSLTSLNVSNFNTVNVTNMYYMFNDCSKLTTLDLSSFNTAKVTNMSYMFSDCSKLTTIYASDLWNTNTVTLSTSMFSFCLKLKGDVAYKDLLTSDKTYATTSGGYLTYKAAS